MSENSLDEHPEPSDKHENSGKADNKIQMNNDAAGIDTTEISIWWKD